MTNNGQAFLDRLANLPPDTFESRFSKTSTRMGLGVVFGRNELTLLYEAAVRAELCTIVLNSRRVADGKIKPLDEVTRVKLETEFLTARDILYASPGWQNLSASERQPIQRIFLTVVIAECNLAP
jgi:hypothetical protein